MANSICGCTCGWQVKQWHPSLTYAIPQRPGGESDSVKVLYKCPVYFDNKTSLFAFNWQIFPVTGWPQSRRKILSFPGFSMPTFPEVISKKYT